MEKIKFIGNKDILNEYKIAFLCSRKYPPEVVLKSYDWAIEQREKGNCVISGFHSQIEKDVLHFLLKGKQPVIMVLARGMKKRWEPEIMEATETGRLLIISPFEVSVRRVSKKTAIKRNRIILDLSDEVYIPSIDKNGALYSLVKKANNYK